MLVIGIFLLIFSRQIIGLYLNLDDPVNAEAISVAVSIVSIAALGQILDALQRTLYGALIGLQDTGVPMLLGTASYLGVGLTTSYLLGFQQGLGGMGVWIGFYTGLAAAAIVFFWRFWRIMSRKALYVK
jgi:multidrug resistance protein, MATE family